MTADTPVIVVRAVAGNGPDRSALDWLAADGRWTCQAHPAGNDCVHLAAVRQLVAGARLGKARPR
jgi:hypothetical protein